MTARLFHVVDAERWSAAGELGEYRAASLAAEGFIHCSFAEQVPQTIERHYRGVSGLVVVELDPERIPAPIIVEDIAGTGTAFPHVYGLIPVAAAVAAHDISAFRLESGAASPDQ